MTTINKHNYEAYLLDFMEGNLSAKDAKALEAFLHDNPQLDADIFDTSGLKLNPHENLHYNRKNTLKRDEEMPEFNQREKLLIGLAENDLNETEKQHAETLLSSDPSAIEDYKLYRRSKLQPDKNIIYPDKSTLKKKSPLISMKQLQYIAVAAVITGLLVVGMLQLNILNTNHTLNSNQIAQDNMILFDAEKTTRPETDISKLNPGASMQTTIAYQNLPVAVRNNNPSQTTDKRTTVIKTEQLPRLTAATIIPATITNYPSATMHERDIPELSPAFPAGDLTYVDNQDNKTRLKMPDRGQIQTQFDNIKPIERLREAKNELIAGNVKAFFD